MKKGLTGLVTLLAAVSLNAFALPAPDDHSVLLYGPTISNHGSSREEQAAINAGLTPVIVDGPTWSAMSTAEFASYRALVIGDPTCSTDAGILAAAEANTAIWGEAVSGNVMVIGSDPTYHAPSRAGAVQVINKGIEFAASDSAKTGAFITLSCYYHFSGALTPVPLLDAFEVGGFSVIGGSSIGGLNNVHIVATHPALDGLADADLSNWGNSVHEAFTSWPISFEVLAMAVDGSTATFTAPDGTVGVPYVLARGVEIISDIDLSPDSASNPVGTDQTIIATVEEDDLPIVGTEVSFEIIAGANTGLTGSGFTDVSGQAFFTYSSAVETTDTIQATYVDSAGITQRSDRVTQSWIGLPPIVCDAGADFDVSENSPYNLDGSATSGGAGLLSYAWSEPLPLDDPSSVAPGGTAPVVDGNQMYLFELTVSDEEGQEATCDVLLTVIDTDLPPDCSSAGASEYLLWPPNHKLYEISVVGVVDEESGATIQITGVTQDEPTNGLGDGDMSPDASYSDGSAMLRAERSGTKDGRVYEVGFIATDDLGQSCNGSVYVGVPHDKKDVATDSGQFFDATVE